MKATIPLRSLILLPLLIIGCSTRVLAEEGQATGFDRAKSHWTFLGGFGQTLKYLSEPEMKVQQMDIVLQYGHFLTEEMGTSWHKARHKILVELPFSYVFYPDAAIMAGLNFLSCWDFISVGKIVPYLFVGGGFVYTNLNIPGLGSNLNGNYQGGIGVHYLINKNIAIDLSCRLHHVSNGNLANPNEPLNSGKILIGVTIINSPLSCLRIVRQ